MLIFLTKYAASKLFKVSWRKVYPIHSILYDTLYVILTLDRGALGSSKNGEVLYTLACNTSHMPRCKMAGTRVHDVIHDSVVFFSDGDRFAVRISCLLEGVFEAAHCSFHSVIRDVQC